MPQRRRDSDDGPKHLPDVLIDELKNIRNESIDARGLDTVFKALHRRDLTALCVSGGGIRSATFGLGIIQSLAKHGLLDKFDYLSTVSGGGYLGSWLSAWILREQRSSTGDESPDPSVFDYAKREGPEELRSDDRGRGIRSVQSKINCAPYISQNPNPEPPQLQHLREFSNYMSPRRGLLSADTWTLAAIYTRNLFLNLTIFIPLIAALFMFPRFVFDLIQTQHQTTYVAALVLLGSILAGASAIVFVFSRLPSIAERLTAQADRKGPDIDGNTDVGVFVFGVLPLVLSALLAVTFWSWMIQVEELRTNFRIAGSPLSPAERGLSFYLTVTATAYVLGAIIFLVASRFKSIDIKGMITAGLATMVGSVLLWLISKYVFGEGIGIALQETYFEPYEWQIVTVAGVPVFLLIVLVSATVYVGLASRQSTDADREWLARYGAWVLIAAVLWIIVNTVVLLGPSFLEYLLREARGSNPLPGIVSTMIAVASGAISVLGGFSGNAPARTQPMQTVASRILSYAPKIAAGIFLIFFLIGISYLTTLLVYFVGHLAGLFNALPERDLHTEILASSSALGIVVLLGLSIVGVVMACFVNVNKFSLHGAYRDRLVRAYLGASNLMRQRNSFTGFDGSDNFQLHRLKDQKPFHVINATLNLVAGKTLAWQNRKAASFTFTPLHCGSWHLGYRYSNDYSVNMASGLCPSLDSCNKLGEKCASAPEGCEMPGKAIRLGTAMAISGAAANPNMGYYSSPIVTFLMSLFNIRLGWWLGNTNERMGSRLDRFGVPYYTKSSPSVAVLPLLNETLGRTDENKRYINITDGGHFENLALYEMVLRRCRYIVLSDGAADASFKFGEIANAIQKCKVDLGVDIRFVGAMTIRARNSEETGSTRFALAEITYPETDEKGGNLTGLLLYTRPTYYGITEPADIRNYAEANVKFPHQSTGDQMYDEKQFEAYRKLGFMTMDEIIGDHSPKDLAELFEALHISILQTQKPGPAK